MYLVVKNNLIKYKFDVEPIFKRGRLVYPVNALDIKEDEVQVVETSQTLDYEFVGGAIGWDLVNHTGFYLYNPEVYNEYLADKNKVQVPPIITPRQIRMQLTNSGLRETVESIINSSTDFELKDWWEYSLDYDRGNSILIAFATQLGLTEEQVDAMFIEASRL